MGFDLTAVPTSEYIDQEGEYHLRVNDYDMKQVNGKNVAVFKCSDVKTGAKTKVELFTNEKALWKLVRFVKALGFSEDSPQFQNWNHEFAINREFIGTVEGRQGNDRTFYDVQDFRPSDRPAATPAAQQPRLPAATPAASSNNEDDPADLPF